MLSWIIGNLATIVVGAVLFAAIAAVIAVMVRGKKKGKTSCGCGCADCAMHGTCHNNAGVRKQKH